MAAEIQTGTATVWGISNDGTAISISGYATFLLEGAKPTHKFRLKEIIDNMDFDAALVATNSHIEMTLNFKPSGSTRSAAAAVAVMLTPLDSVTTSHFKISALNGVWVYTGDEAMDLVPNDSTKMTLPIRKYDDTTQNASLTVTVSG